MSRPYRLQSENTLYHIICRGNERKKIFRDEKDYQKYISNLYKAKEKYEYLLYAYVLMDNHVHLLLETTSPNISKIMHYINSSYCTYFNVKHKRAGHLFQGRYKSIIVDKDSYLMELSRYIHLNPVRAKIVKFPEQYAWSSYNEYLEKGKSDLISKKELRRYADISPKRYKNFVESGIGVKEDFNDKLYAGFILGKTSFIKETLGQLKDQVESKDISHAKDINQKYTIEEILEKYCNIQGYFPDELCNSWKKKISGRKEAIYLIKRLTGSGNAEIGEKFGVSYSRVSKAAGAVEKKANEDKDYRTRMNRILSQVKG